MGELYNPFPKLPKNIRQIGDTDQVVRLYLEDYVNTYLKRLYPTGRQTMRVGVLLGNVEQYDGTPYIFVDGALELMDVETDGERIRFTESTWKKAYQAIEENFPKRTIQGWFLCGGPGAQLSPLNYWKQHGQYFAGKNQLMYLNHGLEGEESIYITSEDGFYRLKGHCVYYERNQMMQDYMITRKDVRRIETGSHEQVIKDFRRRMTDKKEFANLQNTRVSALGMLCGVLSVAVLAGGVALFNNYNKMQQMESVLTSVLPVNASDWDEYKKELANTPDFIIEELSGNVYPTESVPSPGENNGAGGGGEDGKELQASDQTVVMPETMSPDAAGSQGGENQTEGSPVEGNQAEAGQAEGGQVGSGQVEAGQAKESQAEGSQVEASQVGPGQIYSTASKDGLAAQIPQGDAADDNFPDEIEEASPLEPSIHSELVGMDKDPSGAKPRPAINYEEAVKNGYEIYEVGIGETLHGICWKRYNDLSRLSEICTLNHLEDENKINAGQKLILP